MNTITDFVLHYHHEGLTPTPLHDVASGVCSCHEGKNCTSSGKHPRVKRQQAIEANGSTWKGWLEAWPNMNLGILTGEESGVFAVDIDPRHGGDKSLEALIKANGSLPPTPSASTGGGGTHFLFTIPDGMTIKNSVGDEHGLGGIAPGIDIRGNGGLIVVEPSFTKGGYTWVSGLPERQSIALPLDWLLAAIPTNRDNRGQTPTSAQSTSPLSNLFGFSMPGDCSVEEGGRNNFLARAAGWLKHQGVKDAPLFEMLKALNTAKCNPPVDDREVEQVAASINKYPLAANDSDWPQPE
jgi:putative DNA primase/helicase